MQDISMQIKRLEKTLDSLYNKTESNLGASDPITLKSLKAVLFLQGLKHDLETSKIIDE